MRTATRTIVARAAHLTRNADAEKLGFLNGLLGPGQYYRLKWVHYALVDDWYLFQVFEAGCCVADEGWLREYFFVYIGTLEVKSTTRTKDIEYEETSFMEYTAWWPNLMADPMGPPPLEWELESRYIDEPEWIETPSPPELGPVIPPPPPSGVPSLIP